MSPREGGKLEASEGGVMFNPDLMLASATSCSETFWQLLLFGATFWQLLPFGATFGFWGNLIKF